MESDRELACPQCANPFEQRTVQGVVIDYCITCGGVWLDPGELDELTGYKKGTRSRTSTTSDPDYDDDHEEDDDSDGILGFVTDALGGSDDEPDAWDDEWDGGWDSGDGGDGGGGWDGGGGDGGGGGGE